jgi:ATP-dependent Clp protease ATP-binding subunit ClpA
LWSRLDEHLVFLPLTPQQVSLIAQNQLLDKKRALRTEHRIELSWDEDVVAYLLAQGGFCPTTGARGLRKIIAKHIEAPVADLILAGKAAAACQVHLRLNDDGIGLQVQPEPTSEASSAP